jgi:hypothetical protein
MATSTDAQKIEKYRAAANDKTIPQDVRNDMLDKANEMERKAYDATKKLAKGGMVAKAPAKKMAVGGAASKKISEYGGKEMYASKAAMMKHEKKEPMKVEKKEEKMAKGGAVKPMAKKKC